jgi:hypothetical protein
MAYGEPARLNELNEDQLALWNRRLSQIFARQIGAARREQTPPTGDAWLFDPIASPGGDPATATISWTAFPKRIAAEAPTMASAWRRADDSRNNQEEYCEWEVARDPARQNKVIRVTFTCENEDYYRFLADEAPDLLLALYRRHVSPNVQLADLVVNGDYVAQNKWNYPQTAGAHGILMHMAQRNNSFEAAVNLVAVASWPRVDDAGAPITGEQDLIACRPFGDSRRHSDPHIGAQINALVRAGNEVSFADPVGLYMNGFDLSDWETPDGSDPDDWFRIVRGSAEHMMRVVFEAPAAAGDFVLGDVKIGGRRIQFGGQIAEKVEIRIRGLARAAPAPAPALTCGGTPFGGAPFGLAGPAATGGFGMAGEATRVPHSVTLLSPE